MYTTIACSHRYSGDRRKVGRGVYEGRVNRASQRDRDVGDVGSGALEREEHRHHQGVTEEDKGGNNHPPPGRAKEH